MTKKIDVRAERAAPVARTIYNQLGAGAFFMLGAKAKNGDIAALPETPDPDHPDQPGMEDYEMRSLDFGGLRVKIKGCPAINMITIHLDFSDLYTVRFWKHRGNTLDLVSERSDVYAESLHAVIESTTGLRTSIPRIVGVNA